MPCSLNSRGAARRTAAQEKASPRVAENSAANTRSAVCYSAASAVRLTGVSYGHSMVKNVRYGAARAVWIMAENTV